MIPPKITIITPTYHTGESVETSLSSVARQTYRNIEHIIVDGASKDKTLPVIRKYLKTYKHIRLLTEKDAGIYNAMNKGMDLCTGDWIFFMGADDSFYNENVLTDLYEEGLFQEEQVIYGNVMIKGDAPWAKDSDIYDGPFNLEKLFRWNICHQCIFYPRSVIKKVGYYETKYKVTSDWDYNVRCWANYKFTYVDKIIAFFTTGGKSSEGGDYSLHLDFPDNVVKYFQLDIQDSNLYLATSPFYYPMSRIRENEHLHKINELSSEIERLKQHLSDQQTEYSESVTSMQQQQESTTSTLKSEYEDSFASLKTEQENLLAALKSEHESIVKQMQEAHDEAIAQITETKTIHESRLRNACDQEIAGLTEKNRINEATLRNEHRQEIAGLIEKNKINEVTLRNEHNQEIAGLIETNRINEAALRNEHHQEIVQLKEEFNGTLTILKSGHSESINTLKKHYEDIIRTLQDENRASRDHFQQKEAEFMQVIEKNNQHTDELNRSMADQEQVFRKTTEHYQHEIDRLITDIEARNQEIATIFDSYTWKIGKIILAPTHYIHRKLIRVKK